MFDQMAEAVLVETPEVCGIEFGVCPHALKKGFIIQSGFVPVALSHDPLQQFDRFRGRVIVGQTSDGEKSVQFPYREDKACDERA
jgi:hypothetical protein